MGAPRVLQNGRFYRKKGGARELLTKEESIFRPGQLLLGERQQQGFFFFFNAADCLFFLWGGEGDGEDHRQDRLPY